LIFQPEFAKIFLKTFLTSNNDFTLEGIMKKVIALTVFLLLVSFAILDQSTPAQAA
jgi:hypothetical protein